MSKTLEVRLSRSRRTTAPTVTHHAKTRPGPTHLEDEQGHRHVLFTVTCGKCLQQYAALGDHDGVYAAERQREPHICPRKDDEA